MATEGHSRAPVEPSATSATEDFRRLRETGEAAGVSRAIGGGVAAARNAVARGLVRIGATPHSLTLTGFVLTLGAGYCLARGASQEAPYFCSVGQPVGWWPLGAGAFLILAGACDMLDGAVARLGHLSTRFGAILDSVLDRFSDTAIFVGCALHFAWRGNVTYQTLALLALCNAFLISYVKARAENIIPDCSVGYWLRGERFVAVLLACLSGHLPALLWQQALLPFLTVLRRLTYARRAVAAQEAGRPQPSGGPAPGWLGKLQLWRYPRGSIPYDVVTGLNIVYVVFAARIWPELSATGEYADPLVRWLDG